jgi:hypothetical protein
MHGWSPTVQVYKALEPGKEVEAANWVDQAAAYSEIQACRDRARGAGDLAASRKQPVQLTGPDRTP